MSDRWFLYLRTVNNKGTVEKDMGSLTPDTWRLREQRGPLRELSVASGSC